MAKPSLTNCPKHRPSAQRPRAQASDKRQTLVVSKRIQYVTLFQAVIAPGFHLFPFRTEKLSPAAPMVLRKRESRSPPPLHEVPSTHTVRKGLRFFPRCSRFSRFSRCSSISRTDVLAWICGYVRRAITRCFEGRRAISCSSRRATSA